MSVFGRFIGKRSEYNKENELKPIKKQHECAIFYYVVMSGAHLHSWVRLLAHIGSSRVRRKKEISLRRKETTLFLDTFVLHFDYPFQLQLTQTLLQTDTLMCACLSIKDICAPESIRTYALYNDLIFGLLELNFFSLSLLRSLFSTPIRCLKLALQQQKTITHHKGYYMV